MKRYLAAAIGGAVVGGALVAIATNGIPEITPAMQEVMSR